MSGMVILNNNQEESGRGRGGGGGRERKKDTKTVVTVLPFKLLWLITIMILWCLHEAELQSCMQWINWERWRKWEEIGEGKEGRMGREKRGEENGDKVLYIIPVTDTTQQREHFFSISLHKRRALVA